MATACSSSSAARILRAAVLLALPALFAAQVRAVVVSASLVPGRMSLCVGETATLVLDLDLEDAELYTEPDDPFAGFMGRTHPRSEPLRLSGIPESNAIVRFGRFERATAPRADIMRFVATVEAVAPGVETFSPAFSGTLARTVATHGFMRQITTEPFSATAGPLSLRVETVPEDGRPPDFCGAVGDSLLFSASLDPVECAPGDLVTLRWTLSGHGASLASPVDWNPGDGFKPYPPRREEGAADTFAATQIAIPQDASATNAAAFSISWFNPSAKRFETATAGPWTLTFHDRPEPEEAETFLPDQEAGSIAATPRTDASAPSVTTIRQGAEISVRAATPARFAPWPQAKVLFDIPEGTKVTVREQAGNGFLRVLLPGGATGWIRHEGP